MHELYEILLEVQAERETGVFDEFDDDDKIFEDYS